MIKVSLTGLLMALTFFARGQFLKQLQEKAKQKVEALARQSAQQTVRKSGPQDSIQLKTRGTAGPQPAAGNQPLPGETRNEILQLEPGEHLVTGEAVLTVKEDKEDVKLITQQKNDFFFYDNGKKSGPFKSPPVDLLGHWPVVYEYEKAVSNNSYLEFATGPMYQQTLLIDGKKYGPFLVVHSFFISPDKKHFYAEVTYSEDHSTSFYFIGNNTKMKLPAPGAGGNFFVSPHFKSAAIAYTTSQLNAKTVNDLLTDMSHDDVYILLADGTKKGPYKQFDRSEKWLSDRGELYQVIHDNQKQLIVDGKPGPVFGTEITNPAALFLTDEGNAGAYFTEFGSLYFSDGSRVSHAAISPQLTKENGLSVLYWLSFDYTGKIYVCKKPL